MNKSDKKKINHAIGLLEHAVGAVKTVLLSGFHENGIDLLTNMQQITIEIGNMIEEKEKDCSGVIKKLEALCEIYYQCTVVAGDKKETEKRCACMQKYILQVKEDIEKIPVKTEILFLPYQVSMWDSLESIWKAAKEDGQVECYVVPIPVYDVMPDNSLGRLRYEGALYPDDVPVTSYHEYDIERRHPDIIFFHNPYDDINTVTRIPELYYSRNLKKYTDTLVYVPYFVTREGGPAEIQCYAPGVLFADYVVVQPGVIYQRFCRIYTSYIKQHGWEQILTKAEDKFLPFGSPKIDKLLQTECNLANLPKQWQAMIQKADGSMKKIVLYNLTIKGLLGNSEKMLQKIKDVLARFQKFQDEIVLLWRPHPLLRKTIAAMRPQLRDEYEDIIRQYQEEGWGILDETPDSNLAMMLSDAYYGDVSSLLSSYRVLDKPVLLQNVDSNCFYSDDSKMQSCFLYQPAVIDGELWYSSWNMNGLYHFPLAAAMETNFEAVLEKKFENEADLQEALYGDMIQYKDLLIFPPFHAKAIAVYHIKTKKLYDYALPEQIVKITKGKYHTGFVCGHSVYLIGAFSDIEMIRLDMDSQKVELCGCIPDCVAGVDTAEKIEYCILLHDKILIPLACAGAVVEYDIKTEKARMKKILEDSNGQLKGIFYYTENECLLMADSRIMIWNPVDGTCTRLTECPGTEPDRLLVAEKKVYIFDSNNQKIYIYDIESGRKETVSCLHGEMGRGTSGQVKMIPVSYGPDFLIVFSLFYNEFLFIKDGQITRKMKLFTKDIPEIDYDEVFCRQTKTESQFFQCSLEHYLNYIIRSKKKHSPTIQGNAGEHIFQALCK